MMIPIARQALSDAKLSAEELKADMETVTKYEDCGLGRKALYLKKGLFPRMCYIPYGNVERIFKRLAVSKGYYEGRVYGTISYIVVLYGGGKEKVVRFRNEQNLNSMLSEIQSTTSIPIGKK